MRSSGFASRSSAVCARIAWLGMLGSVHGQLPGGPAASQQGMQRTHAYLRFDAPLYKPGQCARLSLTVLESSAGAQGAPQSVEVAAGDRAHAAGRVSVPMRPQTDVTNRRDACVW